MNYHFRSTDKGLGQSSALYLILLSDFSQLVAVLVYIGQPYALFVYQFTLFYVITYDRELYPLKRVKQPRGRVGSFI